MEKPNIVLIVADDHSFGALGAYGNRQIHTPELDRLAREGTQFQSVYTMGSQSAAVCVPCRACLHTGASVFRSLNSQSLYLDDHEDESAWRIHAERTMLPEAFRQAGYRTYGIGKWHNGTESFNRGFAGGDNVFFGGMSEHTGMLVHPYDPSGQYPASGAAVSQAFSTDLFADTAAAFIEQYDANQPFLLYVAFTAPHDPRTPTDAYRSMYDPRHIGLPPNYREEHPFDNGEMSIRDEMLAAIPREAEEIRQHIADYYGMISHLDAKVGQILHALESRGLSDKTIIVYTADHGLAVGQHGLMGKQNLYEHSVHIPLLIKSPGIPPGQVRALGCQIDIFPTLCELAGVERPTTADGQSLAGLMTGREHQIRDTVFAVYKDVQRMVCDGRWKLIRYFRSPGRGVGTDRLQLFDLMNDPWEMNDLSGDSEYRLELDRMLAALRGAQAEAGDPMLAD